MFSGQSGLRGGPGALLAEDRPQRRQQSAGPAPGTGAGAEAIVERGSVPLKVQLHARRGEGSLLQTLNRKRDQSRKVFRAHLDAMALEDLKKESTLHKVKRHMKVLQLFVLC